MVLLWFLEANQKLFQMICHCVWPCILIRSQHNTRLCAINTLDTKVLDADRSKPPQICPSQNSVAQNWNVFIVELGTLFPEFIVLNSTNPLVAWSGATGGYRKLVKYARQFCVMLVTNGSLTLDLAENSNFAIYFIHTWLITCLVA